MKRLIVASASIAAVLVIFAFFGQGGVTAETKTVAPSVTVGDTISLSLENTGDIQWETQSAGGDPLTATIQANVSSNTNWTLTVRRSSNTELSTIGLKGDDDNHNIPSSCFTYSSASGSPAPPSGSGVSGTSFDIYDTNVWTGGTSTGVCRVAITYSLQIPANQLPQGYSATHTYTLTAS